MAYLLAVCLSMSVSSVCDRDVVTVVVILEQGWNCRGEPPPPSSCPRTLIFEWKSAINFNSWAKFQTFWQLTPQFFRSIPTLGWNASKNFSSVLLGLCIFMHHESTPTHAPNRTSRNFDRNSVGYRTRSQAVARIADRTAKNCRGHVT